MTFFCPDYWFPRITAIPASFFAEKGIKLLLLDADNTLTTHNNPEPAPGVMDWLAEMKAAGLQLAILSNNNTRRIAPFAEKLGLSFAANGAKPLPFRAAAACREYGVNRRECALIGDQLFTDILCGNLLSGAVSVLVTPIKLESGPFFKLKRKLESPILRRCQRRPGVCVIGNEKGKEDF